jgi:NADH-quinone oxidoreductase subunit L
MQSSPPPPAAWLWLIPLLPLAGSAICGALHLAALRARRRDPAARGPVAAAAWIACAAVGASLALSAWGFAQLLGLPAESRVLVSPAWDWIRAGSFSAQVAMVLDPLSSTMTLVVTGVGFLIHVYSIGYMKAEAGFAKFFAYMNLFAFAMLVLVLASSLLGLFVGWEGVGLCSFLLIGFWYEKGWPAEAAQKAFVVNRIGDAFFLVGTFLLVRLFGTLEIGAISAGVGELLHDPERAGQLAIAALLLFGGCCGKSAQFPLFTWLPDAMAGPTPVSALIHAATMVTAGIYLIVRLNPLFAASGAVLLVIALVGAATALIGATTALAQRDIKKVLAYSTVSQLGYMFLALGAGAFPSAIFHLVTHAFFKGLLFLGAGSVIHGMHDEQDMHRFGGLKRHMPVTWATFLAGAAALSGLPLFSGFMSKDAILAAAFLAGGTYYLLWGAGVIAAGFTAYYTWRMVALTFHGRERFDPAAVHPHESPRVMSVPLIVLAVLSVVGGVFGVPAVFGPLPNLIEGWLEPVIRPGKAILVARQGGQEAHLSLAAEWALLALGSAVALYFAHRGFRDYLAGPERDERLERERPALAGFLGAAWRIDRFYYEHVVSPLRLIAFVVAVVVDQFAIDGLVNGAGALARGAGGVVRRMSDGSLKSYALWMGAGTVVIALLWMWS